MLISFFESASPLGLSHLFRAVQKKYPKQMSFFESFPQFAVGPISFVRRAIQPKPNPQKIIVGKQFISFYSCAAPLPGRHHPGLVCLNEQTVHFECIFDDPPRTCLGRTATAMGDVRRSFVVGGRHRTAATALRGSDRGSNRPSALGMGDDISLRPPPPPHLPGRCHTGNPDIFGGGWLGSGSAPHS